MPNYKREDWSYSPPRYRVYYVLFLIIVIIVIYVLYIHKSFEEKDGINIVKYGKIGEHGEISGTVVDDFGDPLSGELVSLWVYSHDGDNWNPGDETSQRTMKKREPKESLTYTSNTITWLKSYSLGDNGEIKYWGKGEYTLGSRTNEQGEFVFDCLRKCPPHSSIYIHYGKESYPIKNGTRGIVLKVGTRSYTIKLTCVSSDPDVPLGRVKAVKYKKHYCGMGCIVDENFVSDKEGNIIISPLTLGEYEISCLSASFLSEMVPICITGKEQIVKKKVMMKLGARVRGRIVNLNGNPVSGMMVIPNPRQHYKPDLRHMIQNWETDKEGIFDTAHRLPGLSDTIPPGKYVLSIGHAGRVNDWYMHHTIYAEPGLNDLGDIIWDPSKR